MITDFYEDFILLGRMDASDGLGGVSADWSEDTGFRGGIAMQPGCEVTSGGLNRYADRPVLVHESGISLNVNDCVRRVSDGARFRVMSCSDAMRTPACAALAYAQVTVERLVDGA